MPVFQASLVSSVNNNRKGVVCKVDISVTYYILC